MRRIAGAVVSVTAAVAGVVALAAPSAAQEVPNDNWHSHPPGAPWLVAIAGEVVCPDATDKLLLKSAPRNNAPVVAAGVCMSDTHIVHLRWVSGGSAPSGWSQVKGMPVFYKMTARG